MLRKTVYRAQNKRLVSPKNEHKSPINEADSQRQTHMFWTRQTAK